MSIASDLTAVATNLNSALDEINTKIEAKGGTASETVYGVAAAVENLPSGDNVLYTQHTIKLNDNRYVSTYGTNSMVGCVLASNNNQHNQIIINLSQVQTSARMVIKAKINNLFANNWMKMTGGNGVHKDESTSMWIGTGYKSSEESYIYMGCPKSDGKSITAYTTVPNGIWLYYVIYYDTVSQMVYYSIYNENLTILFPKALNQPSVYNNANYAQFIGGNPTDSGTKGDIEINLNETFFEIDNVSVWGRTNSKTQNMGIFDFSDFSEFTEVEYIESTGTQFIQTDTVIYSTDKVEAEVAFVDRSLTTFAWCAREVISSNFFNALNLTGEFRFDYFDEQLTGPSVINNQKYKITMDGNKFYLDDALIKTFAQVNSNSVNPACLMASYNPYKTYSNIGKMKYFGFRVWDNSSIIKANLVPCYHTATGVIGMFDLVNNKFYMNAGTGTFLKGADVNG